MSEPLFCEKDAEFQHNQPVSMLMGRMIPTISLDTASALHEERCLYKKALKNCPADVLAQNAFLKTENSRLREALTFYAQADWGFYCGCCATGNTPLELDLGDKARAALEGK